MTSDSSNHFGRPRSARRAGLCWALAFLVVLGGCGKKAAPRPPAPRSPLPPTSLLTRQLGAEAVVSLTLPASRGSKPGQRLAEVILLRVAYPPGTPAPSDPSVFDRRGEVVGRIAIGSLEAVSRVRIADGTLDDLPNGGLDWNLLYGVQLEDERRRRTAVVPAGGLTPAALQSAPADLTAEAKAQGIELSWSANGPTPFGYNLYRSRAGEPPPDRPLNEEPLREERHLDGEVETGTAYAYQVRRALAEGLPYRESAPSETVTVVAEDRFAPRAPRGFVAVQEGPAVRLFWDPSPEPDVAGYRLWRREPGGEWGTIGPELIRDNTWLDADVLTGRSYLYRVSALDAAVPANESPPSSEIEVTLGEEPASDGGTSP